MDQRLELPFQNLREKHRHDPLNLPNQRELLTNPPPISQCALLPVIPAAARLSIFYARLFLLSSSYPPYLSAGAPVTYFGMRGQMLLFRYGGLELRFFSMNTAIPWSFVRAVAARLRANTALGFTGLHATVFAQEATGFAVFVTLTAAGVPVPWVGF